MDGSTSPTSTKSALFLFAEFYSPAQINSDYALHKVSQQLSSTQLLGQAASAAYIHWLVSSISNEGGFKRLRFIIAPAPSHRQQVKLTLSRAGLQASPDTKYTPSIFILKGLL